MGRLKGKHFLTIHGPGHFLEHLLHVLAPEGLTRERLRWVVLDHGYSRVEVVAFRQDCPTISPPARTKVNKMIAAR